MKALYIQLQHIVSIKVVDKTENPYYTYVDKVVNVKTYKSWFHKLLFMPTLSKVRQVGFEKTVYDGWERLSTKLVHEDEIKSQGYLPDYTDEKVYYKPYIQFSLRDKEAHRKTFESIKELNLFLNPIIQKNKELIKIIDNETES